MEVIVANLAVTEKSGNHAFKAPEPFMEERERECVCVCVRAANTGKQEKTLRT